MEEPNEKTLKLPKKKERKQNDWVTYVKEYCKKHDIQYRDALRDENCKASYKYEFKKQDD
jgi:hypothetical protein